MYLPTLYGQLIILYRKSLTSFIALIHAPNGSNRIYTPATSPAIGQAMKMRTIIHSREKSHPNFAISTESCDNVIVHGINMTIKRTNTTCS